MTESLENYLESVYLIVKENKVARVKEIADHMGVKKPSVINALRELSNRGFVNHEKYGYVELTSEGEKEAKDILEKHRLLTRFFAEILEVSPVNAEEDACKMEHILSDESWTKLRTFIKERLN